MSRTKSEIDRRTNDASKLAALEARKVAVLEMVADLMQEAVDLMRKEGFTVALAQPATPGQPYVGATVITEASLAQTPVSAIRNPCAQCGQEAHGTEAMPNGTTRYLCKSHYMQRAKEKQEEATTKSLLGSEGTMYQRPQTPVQPVKKILIQAGSDPLLGGPNGAPVPPVNGVLDEADD